jgi:Uma2 family endonuclease
MQVTIAEEAVLRMPDMSDDAFFDFCTDNREYRIERSAKGQVTIMSGTGGRTGNRNGKITSSLIVWSEADGRGIAFDSSTMFLLPDGAMRSPDGAWVQLSRLQAISSAQRDRYLPVCPDFVIELRSPTDRLSDLHAKMQEWMANGCALGWLLDPSTKTAFVYSGAGVTELASPAVLSGEGLMSTFTLDLSRIWDPGW